jgi:hypothetical protein
MKCIHISMVMMIEKKSAEFSAVFMQKALNIILKILFLHGKRENNLKDIS